MTTFEVSVTSAMEKAMTTACRDVSIALVGELATQHGFDADAAISSLGLDRFVTKRAPKGQGKAKEPKEKVRKPTMPLPYCGVANKCNCRALRLNHGLHTQCTQKVTKGMRYCKTCQKGADRSATGKPTYGTIEDRMAVGILEYVDPKGKRTIPYANVMEKLNISRADAETEVAKFSELVGASTIPEEHFTKRESKRGRPKKETTEADDAKPVKKSRGRPSKSKKLVSGADGDLTAALQTLAAAADSDAESVGSEASSTSSRGRPRLSEEEKQRRAEEKAAAKVAREEAAALKRQEKEAAAKLAKEEREAAKAAKDAEKAAAKEAKDAEKAAAKAAKEAAKAEKEAAAAQKKAEAEAAIAAKRDPLIVEITALATETGKTVTEFPEKIGELRSMIADMKREIREAAKEQKPTKKVTVEEPATQVTVEEPATQVTVEEEGELEEEDDEIDVEKFEHNGVSYLKGADNLLYDTEGDVKGVWNPTTSTIDAAPEDSDEEEEDSDEED